MKRLGLIAWLALPASLLLAPTGLFAAEFAQYEVVGLSTVALAWRSYSTGWTSLKVGDRIPEGTLVQIPGEGKLVLTGVPSEGGGLPPQGVAIDVQAPIIMRVTPELMRRIEFGGYFLTIPQLKGQKKEPPGDASFSIAEAWERTAALFDKSDKGKGKQNVNSSDIGAGGGGSDTASLPTSQKELPLLFPRSGDNYLVERLPTPVAVRWTAPDAKPRRYIITLNRIERGGRKIVQTTTETYSTFDVDQSGRYRATVETEDGMWRSAPHNFSVSQLEP